jgi:hypothetical protein
MSQKSYLAPAATMIGPLIARYENCQAELDTELRKRRLKNIQAELKVRHISLPAFRALLLARKRLRVARQALVALPPHRRAEVAQLARAIGETSDLFQFEPLQADPRLQALR